MGRRIASQSKQTVRGGPKPAKVGLHRRLRLHLRFVRIIFANIILQILSDNVKIFVIKHSNIKT